MTVVITGLGVISPYGSGAECLIAKLLLGSVASKRRAVDGWPGTASVDERDIADVLGGERRRGLNMETKLLLAVASLALTDADLEHLVGEEVGIAISTRHAGLDDYAELFLAGMSGAVGAVNPAQGPQTGFNAPAAHLSIRLRASGPNMTMSNGAVGGLDAVSHAVDVLRAGDARVMLVGGVEVFPRIAGAFPLERTVPPGSPWARPFDRRRDGPVPGEAGVMIVLEDEEHARRRDAPVRAEVCAVRSAFSPQEDLVEASLRSLRQTLHACSTDADEVAAGFAGANGSVLGDAAEAQALHELLGDRVPICAIKGAVAESEGASALTQVAVATLSLERRIVPPTIGFEIWDDDLPALGISTRTQPLAPGAIVVHAWDETCYAASAVLRRCQPVTPLLRFSTGRRATRAR